MEQSILNVTKKNLGLDSDFTDFDTDVITHINAAFSVLGELGVGPDAGFEIDGADQTWDLLGLTVGQLSKVKTYVYLKVRMLFDPPSTSFHIDAMKNQIQELEWRLNVSREVALPPEVNA